MVGARPPSRPGSGVPGPCPSADSISGITRRGGPDGVQLAAPGRALEQVGGVPWRPRPRTR
jgi:hypothetical protein